MDYRICTIPGCDKRSMARGWCSKHWQRWQKHGDPNYTPAPSRVRNGSKPTRFVTVGQRFGRWIVTGPEVRIWGNLRAAPVKCSCPRGIEKTVSFGDLFDGRSRTCGCLKGEATAKRNREANPSKTHGLASHPLYDIWKGILKRCDNPSDKNWPNYGGRGIRAHPEWQDVRTFIAWVEANLAIRPRPSSALSAGPSFLKP